jgi:hypothetical protein
MFAGAEQLIQSRADAKIVHQYFKDKSQILFGSLSDPITQYQRENRDLRKQFETAKQTKPTD